jgi:hypothetical protein
VAGPLTLRGEVAMAGVDRVEQFLTDFVVRLPPDR